MKRETADMVIALLADIAAHGLLEVVRGNHAFETLGRILETGTSLPNGIYEPPEDTEDVALTFSRLELWGISDPKWKDFLNERGTR